MDEITIWMRVVQNLIDRISGPMNFRFILQPLIASIFEIIAGVRDAKAGKPPYFWNLMKGQTHRVGKVIIVALVLDIAYQIILLRFVYPGEMLIAAFVIVITPYLILRDPLTRLVAKR